MEVSALLNIIRIKLADTLPSDGNEEGSLFTTDELVYYINNALREAVFRGKMLVSGNYTIDLVSGIGEYDVPTNVVRVTQILDKNEHEITKIQEVDFLQKTFNGYDNNLGSQLYRNDWRNDTRDLPTNYMQNTTNNKLVFYPIPSIGSTVTLRGTYIPEDVDATDDIPDELSPIYQRDLIYGVLAEAYDKQDADSFDPDASDKNRIMFERIFGEKMTGDQFQEMLEFPDDPGSLRDY